MATEKEIREQEGRPEGKHLEHYYRARQILLMFCSTSCYKTKPENIDEVVQIFQKEALPTLPRYPGFI